jgi:hypothetical protein
MKLFCVDCKFHRSVKVDERWRNVRHMCDHPHVSNINIDPVTGWSLTNHIDCSTARGEDLKDEKNREYAYYKMYAFCGVHGEFFEPKGPEVPAWKVFREKGWQWWF